MYTLRKTKWGQGLLLTLGTLITTLGVYFFKFPNNFSFGGVTGIAVVLGHLTPWSPGTVTFILNMLLLVVGFLFIGRSFGAKTVYCTVLMSSLLWLLEKVYPLSAPLTDQKFLEFVLAILLPSFGAAILFNIGASGGGTDIIAIILKQKTGFDTGSTLFLVDSLIMVAAFFVFDIQTGLYAFVGLVAKTMVINGSISDLNLCKYFHITCDDPEPICRFIHEHLHRGATVCEAQGAYSQKHKNIIFTVVRRSQAMYLRSFIRTTEPGAFITICNSSEIQGKGFEE